MYTYGMLYVCSPHVANRHRLLVHDEYMASAQYIYIYIYIYTHTPTYIYIYIHTHPRLLREAILLFAEPH